MAVKIGIAGTHSTGKTTLLRGLARELRGKGYSTVRVSDLATKAQQLGFPILAKHNFSSTLWIISRGISRELEAALTADVILVDRPVPDALGYLYAAMKLRRYSLSKAEASYLWNITALHAATYALLFKTNIDPSKPLGAEKIRDTDLRFRKFAAQAIDQVFAKLRIPVISLPIDSSRAEQLLLNTVFSFLHKRRHKGAL